MDNIDERMKELKDKYYQTYLSLDPIPVKWILDYIKNFKSSDQKAENNMKLALTLMLADYRKETNNKE